MHPIVTIKWYDHWATGTNDSYSLEEVRDMAKRVIRTTSGHLVYENKYLVVICSTIEEDDSVTECNFIFKRGILSRSDKQ